LQMAFEKEYEFARSVFNLWDFFWKHSEKTRLETT
jgi:hypothetical protein